MEIAFRIIEIVVSLLAVIAVVFGWIIPYKQSIKAEKISRENEKLIEQRKWKKQLIDEQISKLYGPIDQLCRESKITFDLICFQFGRKVVFESDKSLYNMPKEQQRIWIHYVENYVIPNLKKIVEILRENIHLLKDSTMPESMVVFLDYALGWELVHNQAKSGFNDYYEFRYSYNYPENFRMYISSTLASLLKEQNELTNA